MVLLNVAIIAFILPAVAIVPFLPQQQQDSQLAIAIRTALIGLLLLLPGLIVGLAPGGPTPPVGGAAAARGPAELLGAEQGVTLRVEGHAALRRPRGDGARDRLGPVRG